MNLILSDRHLDIPKKYSEKINLIDLSQLKISNCVGCFGCWVKTPGKCVIRDDAIKVYPLIAKSNKIMYVSHIKYGGYDTIMKTMLERAIPVQKAFIRILDGETHHVQRNVVMKQAIIIAYGAKSQEEKKIFTSLVERNSKNMSFESFNIIFTDENDVEKYVIKEVEKWEK